MENNFIYSDRGDGKTEFLTKLANGLYKSGNCHIEFFSLTRERISNLDSRIRHYNSTSSGISNIINYNRRKISSGELDIILIDNINFLDNWIDLLALDCKKYITVNMPDKRVDEILEKLKNKINYNLFSLSEIQHSDFLKPYLRDKKLDILLND